MHAPLVFIPFLALVPALAAQEPDERLQGWLADLGAPQSEAGPRWTRHPPPIRTLVVSNCNTPAFWQV